MMHRLCIDWEVDRFICGFKVKKKCIHVNRKKHFLRVGGGSRGNIVSNCSEDNNKGGQVKGNSACRLLLYGEDCFCAFWARRRQNLAKRVALHFTPLRGLWTMLFHAIGDSSPRKTLPKQDFSFLRDSQLRHIGMGRDAMRRGSFHHTWRWPQ